MAVAAATAPTPRPPRPPPPVCPLDVVAADGRTDETRRGTPVVLSLPLMTRTRTTSTATMPIGIPSTSTGPVGFPSTVWTPLPVARVYRAATRRPTFTVPAGVGRSTGALLSGSSLIPPAAPKSSATASRGPSGSTTTHVGPGAFYAPPRQFVEDVCTIYNACAWTQALQKRMIDTETDRLDGQLSARQLLKEHIFARTSLHQTFLILVTRYTVLQSQAISPALAGTFQDHLLTPGSRDAV